VSEQHNDEVSRAEAIKYAQSIIAGKSETPDRILLLARTLANFQLFSYAREVIDKAHLQDVSFLSPIRLDLLQKWALYTYKDQDLPLKRRLASAETRLREIIAIDPLKAADPTERVRVKSIVQDTYGLLGAINKLRWSAFGNIRYLRDALRHYEAGYLLGISLDDGYTALNTAFVLDLVARHSADQESLEVDIASLRSTQAEEIRQKILAALLPSAERNPTSGRFWLYVTIGESFLGTGKYPEACTWMRKASALNPAPWQLETTARQIAQLARLQARKEGKSEDGLAESNAWTVIQALLGDRGRGALSYLRGKVGLALSGGGFRAALYHIGVFARLAELDMLRHVEVISCVSGGSIVGAYYYLMLQSLLESKTEAEITREDYIEIVRAIERDFLNGVQKNIRMRMLFSPLNLFTFWRSSTERLAILYEKHFYAGIAKVKRTSVKDLYINRQDLKIIPHGESTEFYPRYDNWKREHKVPILILNATVLNTCHHWQFTATYMGEPPQRLDSTIDGNDWLRRMYYSQAPSKYRKFPLGKAVAASACVPGLFDPLVLDELYAEGYIPRLVDGGVYDNQGTASLLEEECNVLLISDASGQTAGEKESSVSQLPVALRANSTLQARIRQSEYELLSSLRDASSIRSLMYIHLKKNLEGDPINWKGSLEPSHELRRPRLTSYGMSSNIQRKLAAIRTDLDAFSFAEADALMLSGYLMTDEYLPKCVAGFPLDTSHKIPHWTFLKIQSLVQTVEDTTQVQRLNHHLKIAESGALKAFQLIPGFKAIFTTISLGALVAFCAVCLLNWNKLQELRLWTLLVPVLVVLLASFILQLLLRFTLGYRRLAWQLAGSIGLAIIGIVVLPLHLGLMDRIYVHWGDEYRH
jgi:predicted acylesterase/phospholipase RssA